MRITRIDLAIVTLPLVRPFRTSSSLKSHIQHILIRVEGARGKEGWGECASPADPYYCPETTETCWHILHDFLAPAVVGKPWATIDELIKLFGPIKGNNFARAGLEMACWDLMGQVEGRSLASMLGGTRTEIFSGVSLGIERDFGRLSDQIAQYLDEGYRRIKLKIGPGHDVEVVRKVRERFGPIPLQVDANSSYTLEDIPILKHLDEFDLLLIEQPLAHDDIIDHARLQSSLETPICLDESIHSAGDARKALELGACRIINIKVSRVGGLREAKRIHDLCHERGVPVWCGGMHEFGIGRAANIAIASLPGFSLPGDISGSDKYYQEDLVEPPIQAKVGAIDLPTGPGLGPWPQIDRIRRATTRFTTMSQRSDGVKSAWHQHPVASGDILRDMRERVLSRFNTHRDAYLEYLRELVESETPSRDKSALDTFARGLAERFGEIGGRCEIVSNSDGGDHLMIRWSFGYDELANKMDRSRRPALILAHYDTVWPSGTAATRPFRFDERCAYGPGIYDMKASLLILELAMRSTCPHRDVEVLITSDEEIGSPTSRTLIEERAKAAEYVLVLEPPLADGSLKTSRKGVGSYTIEVVGRSAHAGVEPEKGASAIVELSHQIMTMQTLGDAAAGTTLNVGVISGGTTPNVVPEHATARVDARASTADEAARIDAAIRNLRPATPGTSILVTGGFNRPPMERSPAIADLFARARQIAELLGTDLTEGSTGGGSDGNFTASLGVPTLDGLGALGGGAHAQHEHILIDSMPERAALLAALLHGL